MRVPILRRIKIDPYTAHQLIQVIRYRRPATGSRTGPMDQICSALPTLRLRRPVRSRMIARSCES